MNIKKEISNYLNDAGCQGFGNANVNAIKRLFVLIEELDDKINSIRQKNGN